MKRIGLRVAVALTAVAAMTALMAVSASAGTVLCENQATTCSQENIKPEGSYLVTGNITDKTAGLSIKWFGSQAIRCSEDLVSVKTTARIGNPLSAELKSAIDPAECEQPWFPQTKCTSVTMNSPSTSLEAAEGGGVIGIGSASSPLVVSFTCDFNGEGEDTCTYQAKNTVAMTLSEGDATVAGAPLERTAGKAVTCTLFAGGLTLWIENIEDGTSYVSQATETVLCGEPGVSPCPNSAVLPAGSLFLAGALSSQDHLTIGGGGGSNVVDCGNFGLGFDTTEQSGQPLDTEGEYGSVQAGSCTAYRFLGSRPCSDATINTPDATIEATAAQEATVSIGSAEQPLVLSFTCENYEFNPVCTYEATGSVTMAVDGVEGTVVVEGAPLKRVQGLFLICGPESGTTLDIEGHYNYESMAVGTI